jgi:GNAT superfamily N-acetyltransferase
MNLSPQTSRLLPDFLPGKFQVVAGSAVDYDQLSPFHYAAARPATFASIRSVRYKDPVFGERLAGVGVLSYPVPSCDLRDQYFGTTSLTRSQKLAFANRNLRTISRIIVHPQFRSLSLSTVLIHALCDDCDTPYIEALAAMGRAHPLFNRAGFTAMHPRNERKPLYFIRWLQDKGAAHARIKVPKTNRKTNPASTG